MNQYSSELDNLQYTRLKYSLQKVQLQILVLINYFKNTSIVILKKLNKKRYTINNIRNKRSIYIYIAFVIRYTKVIDNNKSIQQLVQTYNNLNTSLKIFID